MARTAQHHEEKKALIVQAATNVFAAHGYDGTSNKLIAQRAGELMGKEGQAISAALIYHYFPNGKAQLFAACLEQIAPLNSFQRVTAEHADSPAETFLLALAQAYNASLVASNVMTVIRLKVIEGHRHPELHGSAVADLGMSGVQEVLVYLARQQQQGTLIAQRRPDQILLLLLAPIAMRRMTLALLNQHAKLPPSNDDEAFLTELVADVLHGVRAMP